MGCKYCGAYLNPERAGCSSCGVGTVEEALEIELDKKDREISRLKKWVADLQSGMYVNCVYCGFNFGPEDKVATTMSDALKEHVERCPKHPMNDLRKRIEEAEKTIERLKSGDRGPSVLIGSYTDWLFCRSFYNY
jgi:hypothetical protein